MIFPPFDDPTPIDPACDLRFRRAQAQAAEPPPPPAPAEPSVPELPEDDFLPEPTDDYQDAELEADPLTDDEIREAQSQCTDAANADAVFLEVGRGRFLYVTEWERWIAWDGQRWYMTGGKSGARDLVVQAVIRTARLRWIRASKTFKDNAEKLDTLKKGDPESPKVISRLGFLEHLLKHLQGSQNGARINACVALLQAPMGVSIKELDVNPWLFNVKNGTVDLKTGELLDHDRLDLITQLSDIEFDPAATCPLWTSFLTTSMGSSTMMRLYLQRVVGYEMTALVTEQCLFFHHGGGSNGKSTFRGIVMSLLGEYACVAARDLIVANRNGLPAHPTELARLYSKRFAGCAEIGQSDTLNESKLKDLTGGDSISCRRMNEDFWDLSPTHKLDLFGNHKPRITGTDQGIWRRIRLIPWHVSITDAEKDKDLGAKLRAELSGILNWGIAGCLEWQRVGLAEPEEVKAATGAYREESDVLGEFLRDHCVLDPDARSSRVDFRKRYERWCEDLGHMAVGARLLADRLRELKVVGCTVRRDGRVVDGWAGIRLKSETEQVSFGVDLADVN